MALWPALFSRPARIVRHPRPSLTLFFWLVGAFLLTLVPHVAQFPLWVTATVIVAMIIRSVLEWRRLPLPSTTFCALLALCLLIGILLQFHTVFGRDAGTAFMAGLLAIKFFELRGPRDVALIIFSSYFVVMSALLYSQAVELFIYCLIMMWLLTATLLRTNMGDAPDRHLLGMLRQSAVIFLQALPLTLFLFFFFPRYTGKLQVNLDDSSIGLTDRVEPGSISSLQDDDRPAMRVTFLTGDTPGTGAMYWRALVLWQYRDGVWTAGTKATLPEPQPLAAPDSNLITQEITIWPHFQKWLFALDYPVKPATNPTESPAWSEVLSGDVLQLSYAAGKLDHKEQYTVTSSPTLADQKLTDSDRDSGIQLPENEIDPQVRELADRLHRDNPDVQSYIDSIYHYFRHEGFVYDTSPGATGPKWLASFLFKTKKGFCEHYASALAVLMRLENIPARLVVGYQGGEYNPYGNFYIVRQANAHAWVEVWIDAKKHWVRFDPTLAVTMGGNATLAAPNSNSGHDNEDLSIELAHHRLTLVFGAHLPAWLRGAIVEMLLRREQIEAEWDNWIFSYDPEAQSRLAQALGFGRENSFGLALACLFAAGICALVFRRFIRQRKPVSPVEHLYAKFCRSMAQRGIPRATWEGPLAYTQRVAEAFPEKREAIRGVGEIVARTRYGPSPVEASAPRELQSLLLLITASQTASSSRERR